MLHPCIASTRARESELTDACSEACAPHGTQYAPRCEATAPGSQQDHPTAVPKGARGAGAMARFE
eukprot:scaffold73210_cov53-Phaeocystis_antarctica.AAC.2